MRVEVLMSKPDEDNEYLRSLGVTNLKKSDNELFFADAYIRKEGVESIFVLENEDYGKIMQVYSYGQEIPLTCKFDESVINEIFS